MAQKNFDANQLSVVFGTSPIVGFATDNALSIETEDMQYKSTRDLHGNVTRYRINNNSAKITLNLTQASRSNALLSNYVELDRQSDSGVFPIYIKNADSTTLFRSDSAYVEKVPTNEYGEEEKNREWIIMATDNTHYIGN
jgi:hypothetical protein